MTISAIFENIVVFLLDSNCCLQSYVDQLKLVSVGVDPVLVKTVLWREYSFLSFVGTQSVVMRRPAFRKAAHRFVA